jgi:xanthine dehydrogenase accessory factor
LAQTLNYEVIVIDPRSAFATPERFPAVKMLSHQYPDKVLPTLDLDSETYIAVLTHDPKIDDPALRVALPSPAPYIGVMSSKRSHALRVERLIKAGVEPKLIERIHTPIGLGIGAQSPEEIALSIMAEIVSVRNGSELKQSAEKAAVPS